MLFICDVKELIVLVGVVRNTIAVTRGGHFRLCSTSENTDYKSMNILLFAFKNTPSAGLKNLKGAILHGQGIGVEVNNPFEFYRKGLFVEVVVNLNFFANQFIKVEFWIFAIHLGFPMQFETLASGITS